MRHTISFVISEVFLYVIAKVEIGSHLIYCSVLLVHVFVKLLDVHLVCDGFTFATFLVGPRFMHIITFCHLWWPLKVIQRCPSDFLRLFPERVFEALTGLGELISMFNKVFELFIFFKTHWRIIKLRNSTCIRWFLILILRYFHLSSKHIHSFDRHPLRSFIACPKWLIHYLPRLLIYRFNVFKFLDLIRKKT